MSVSLPSADPPSQRPIVRVRRAIAGSDTAGKPGLPVNELIAPLPFTAVALLVLNDWVLKGSSAPGWLTGKLSDFAGVFVFPLVVTATLDLATTGLAVALDRPWDGTLRRGKLVAAILVTGVVFGAAKLSPAIGGWVESAWSMITPGTIAADPSDAIALVTLAATWWCGRSTIARGAYGRLALARKRAAAGAPLAEPFADAARCGADPVAVDRLHAAVAHWLAGGGAEAVDTALDAVRSR